MLYAISGKINVTFLITLCLIAASIGWTNAQCQTCQASNSAYCQNTTHYYPCIDGKSPELDLLSKCPDGKLCTDSTNLCESLEDITASEVTAPLITSVCAESAGCNTCHDGTSKLACVTKTEYAFCVANVAQATTKSCGANEICSLKSLQSGAPICVPECVASFNQYQPTCSNDVTTPAPPVTTVKPDTGVLRKHCADQCAAQGTLPYCNTNNPDSLDCKTYLSCEQSTADPAVWDFFILKCTGNLFFETAAKKCTTTACPPSTSG